MVIAVLLYIGAGWSVEDIDRRHAETRDEGPVAQTPPRRLRSRNATQRP
jgi:hypothetical protein